MTIRVTCDQCGSVLKIKDELAGTDGKCPKCKTRFVVPQAAAEEPVSEEPHTTASAASPHRAVAEPAPPARSAAKPAGKPPEKHASKPGHQPAEDEDFDPVSFLMDGPRKKPTLDADPEPAPRSPKSGASPPRSGGGGGFSLDEDESGPDQEFDKPAPTRKWGAKKDGSAATAADRSLAGSTNTAKDLLAKSMEESRLRAAEMPPEEPRFNFDFAGFFREVGVKGLGSIAGIVVAVFGLWWVMNSMLKPRLTLPPLGYVSGTVTSGGKPVSGVMVSFRPIEKSIAGTGRRKESARDSVGITDSDGYFVLYYLPETQGVKVGPCRVILEAMDPSVVIPHAYGMASQHKVDVKKGSNPPQKIEL